MQYFFSALFAIVGITFLIYNRYLSEKLGLFYAKRFLETFGRLARLLKWDDSTTAFNKIFYRGFVIVAGVILLIFSFAVSFGPIDTTKNTENSDSILYVPSIIE